MSKLQSVPVLNLFIALEHLNSLLENELVLISGKKSPVRITYACKTGQSLSTTCRRGIKEHLFYRPSPRSCFWILRLFSFRTEESRCAFEENEIEILQRNIEENSNNLVQNQEQVAVVSIASVVKTSTSSCCSGRKSRIPNKNSSSDSREWTWNQIIGRSCV